MRLLLDTSIVIRLGSRLTPIPASLRESIVDATQIYMSSVSRAEIAIKVSIGKLDLPSEEAEYWEELVSRLQAVELPFTSSHASRMTGLPLHHRDPFDRMLVAQCIEEDLVMVTTDTMLRLYGITILT